MMDQEEPTYSFLYSKGYMLYRLVMVMIFSGTMAAIPIVCFINERRFVYLAIAVVLLAGTVWIGIYFGRLNRPVGTNLYNDRLEILEMNISEVVLYCNIKEIVIPGKIETMRTDFYVVDLEGKHYYFSNLFGIQEIAQRLHELTGKPIRTQN